MGSRVLSPAHLGRRPWSKSGRSLAIQSVLAGYRGRGRVLWIHMRAQGRHCAQIQGQPKEPKRPLRPSPSGGPGVQARAPCGRPPGQGGPGQNPAVRIPTEPPQYGHGHGHIAISNGVRPPRCMKSPSPARTQAAVTCLPDGEQSCREPQTPKKAEICCFISHPPHQVFGDIY